MYFFLCAYWIYLIPSLPITVLCWYFTKNRRRWYIEDALILIVPFIVWAICFFAWSSNKSLANLGVEPFYLGCSAALSPIVKYVQNRRIDERKLSFFMIVFISFIGIGLWLFMPALPE